MLIYIKPSRGRWVVTDSSCVPTNDFKAKRSSSILQTLHLGIDQISYFVTYLQRYFRKAHRDYFLLDRFVNPIQGFASLLLSPFQNTTHINFSHLFQNTPHFFLEIRTQPITTHIHLLLIQYEWSGTRNKNCFDLSAQIYMSCVFERRE